MELLVLGEDLIVDSIVDVYEDLIWTTRYNGAGDFELHTRLSPEILNICQKNRLCQLKDSSDVMIIENLKIESSVEDGIYLSVVGRSLESILDRRIVWTNTILTGSVQNGIQQLLNENVINPLDPNRKIPNLIFEASTDPRITSLTIPSAQYSQTSLYQSISDICQLYGLGYDIFLDELTNKFVFKLKIGENRSYDQNTLPYVIFSTTFENLIDTSYSEDDTPIKNVILVYGEGEPPDRLEKTVGTGTGLDRRETFTNALDISKTVNNVTITDAEYLLQLEQKGLEFLASTVMKQTFDAQIDPTKSFIFNRDFFVGDIVQITSDYGLEAKAQITEMIRSKNASGYQLYPKFEIIF